MHVIANATLFLIRLGHFLQAVVEERPVLEDDIFDTAEGVFDSSAESRLTPLYLNWEELTYSKIRVKVYEHSGAKPTPRSTFRLRYATEMCRWCWNEISVYLFYF